MSTKLEILQTYTDEQKRDSWVALGSNVITDTTRTAVRGQIYQVQIPASGFNNALVFALEDYLASEPLDWVTASLVDADRGEISFQPNGDIISPIYRLILTGTDFLAITAPVDLTFVPFLDEFQDTAQVLIPDEELDVILRSVGVPFILYDELEFSRQQIKDLAIRPAFQEYFKWFPKRERYTYPIAYNSVIEEQFPTGAYEILHIAVNQGIARGQIRNPLLRYFDEVIWTANNPSVYASRSTGSPRTQVGDWSSMLMNRAERQALVNYATRVHHHTEWRDGVKYLVAYSNKLGSLEVHYAFESLNWADTEFARRPELRKLCEAEILHTLGSLRSQVKTDIPGAMDYRDWVTRADTIRKDVQADWKSIVKYTGIVRGSH